MLTYLIHLQILGTVSMFINSPLKTIMITHTRAVNREPIEPFFTVALNNSATEVPAMLVRNTFRAKKKNCPAVALRPVE